MRLRIGLLKRYGRGATTRYAPAARLLHPETGLPEVAEQSVRAGEKPVELGQKPVGLHGESIQPAQEPMEQGEKSTKLGKESHKHPEESHKGGGKPHELELPPELAAAIADLNRWTPQPDMRRLIRRLCAWRPLSAEELSEIIGRSRDYLRATYIGPMVRTGEMEYTNPENPKDPNQKYRAAPDADG
jgi:hypothetical protein